MILLRAIGLGSILGLRSGRGTSQGAAGISHSPTLPLFHCPIALQFILQMLRRKTWNKPKAKLRTKSSGTTSKVWLFVCWPLCVAVAWSCWLQWRRAQFHLCRDGSLIIVRLKLPPAGDQRHVMASNGLFPLSKWKTYTNSEDKWKHAMAE